MKKRGCFAGSGGIAPLVVRAELAAGRRRGQPSRRRAGRTGGRRWMEGTQEAGQELASGPGGPGSGGAGRRQQTHWGRGGSASVQGRRGKEMMQDHQPERIWSSEAQRQAGIGWLELQ